MGLYAKRILPYLIDLSMKDRATTQCRSKLIPEATGRVLDVGIGSGLNLPFYGHDVVHVYGIDVSPKLLEMARRKTNGLPFSTELLHRSAEEIPLDDKSIDTVVLTWTLCTIRDAERALREMKRVLKPDGRVIFAEHGLSPDPNVQAWQQRLNPLWSRIAGGCNVNRKIDALLTSAGFRIARLETSYSPGPKFLSYTYQGLAV